MMSSKLRKFREEKGMVAAELGKMIGMSAAGVLRNEQQGAVQSYWRYTRRINAAFGTNFPDMSVCKVCGCEFEGRTRKCPECTKESKKPIKKEVVSLHQAAKEAQKRNSSYGEFSAGITKIKPERNIDAPAFLNLGRTITI